MDKKDIKKILVIRFRRIGDATLSVTLCSSLKRSFPQAEIHYVLNENIAPLFSNHPDIDRIVTFSSYDMAKNMRYIRKVKSLVNKEKYDIIIDTRSTLRTLYFSMFSLGTPYRIGRKKIYTPLIHNYRINNHPNGIKDTITLMLELLDPLKEKYEIIKERNFKLFASEEETGNYKKYLESKGIDLEKKIIVCAVTARIEFRAWSKDKMKEILDRIIRKYPDSQLIFNYAGDQEKAAAYYIYESLGSPQQVFIDIEAKNLSEFKALLSVADFFFGNEGGARHMAQAIGVPAFAIYPPNVPKTGWLPNPSLSNQGIELRDIDPEAAQSDTLTFEQKLELIDVDSVWKQLKKMLENNL